MRQKQICASHFSNHDTIYIYISAFINHLFESIYLLILDKYINIFIKYKMIDNNI